MTMTPLAVALPQRRLIPGLSRIRLCFHTHFSTTRPSRATKDGLYHKTLYTMGYLLLSLPTFAYLITALLKH
jgi:hypothetical protein